MTDIQALTNPQILDVEALHEFADSLADRAAEIESDMAKLSQAPQDKLAVAGLFRALHNIKGDAALCRVATAGLIAHPLESLLTRVRSGEVRYTQLIGEVILLAIDRLELATEMLVTGRSLKHLKLVPLVEGLERMSQASQNDLELSAAQLIEAATGFQPHTKLQAPPNKLSIQNQSEDSVADDLRFFRSLALQFEARSPLFLGRTDRIRQLGLDTNHIAGTPVDAAQLEAALYLHDLGMMLLPESIWLQGGKITEEERIVLHTHPELAAGLLDRMEAWQDAAKMVRQHHEKSDGSGYPDGLHGETICAGAKILAIVDAFEAVMLKHRSRSHSSSVLRAIAEINACDNQFSPEWIAPFNTVIRTLLEHP